MNVDVRIAKFTQAQLGLVTRSQADEVGISESQIYWLCRQGRWKVVRRNVYAVTTTPPSREQMLLAAVLAVEGSVLSHWSAADLWRIGAPVPGDEGSRHVELTVPNRKLVRQRGLIVHRSPVLPPSHRTARHGVPVTSFARTLVDLSSHLPASQLKEMADDGVRRGRLVVAHLRSTVRALEKAPGRRPAVIHEVLEHFDDGVVELTDSEREVWLLGVLRDAGFPEPVPQLRVRIGKTTYVLDLALADWKVALEYDGWGAHRSEVAFHRDRERRRRLLAAGWLLVEVTKRTRAEELVADLWQIVAERAAG